VQVTTGIDLVELSRFSEVLDRFGERFLKRIFTLQEQVDAGHRVASLAARFAAKEAVAKALGCGIGPINWTEIEILRGRSNQPVLHLHGAAARLSQELGLNTWSISLSHTQAYAVAIAVAVP
jgi:holo-[acyl-carrier protein] synthase